MRVMPCATCTKVVDLTSVKYYTADQQYVFCDAYCSNKWYAERDAKEKDKQE